MEKNKINIDDLFKDELGGYTETPPPAAWGALEKKLDAVPPPRPRLGNRIWFMALVSLLFLIGIPAAKYVPGMFATSNNNNNTGIPAISKTNNLTTGSNTANNTLSTEKGNSISNTGNTNGLKQQAPNKEQAVTTGNKQAKSSGTNTSGSNKIATANQERRKGNKVQNVTAATKLKKGDPSFENRLAKIKEEIKALTAASNAATENDSQPVNVYSGKLSEPAPADQSAETPSDDNKVKDTVSTIKKTNTNTPKPNNMAKTTPKKMPKPKYSAFEFGIKGGYESGFDNESARKGILSPYLQYNISPDYSIMIQPAIKEASLPTRRIGNPKAYSKANNDSAIVAGPTLPVIELPGGEIPLYITHYTYTQSHDSIVKSYSIGGTYTEFEIPLLLKYKIVKNFSIYAGVNFIYSRLTGVNENTYTKKNIQVGPTDTVVFSTPGQQPVPYAVNSIFRYSGTPYSTYSGPLYTGSGESTWRAGYMVGFSCEFAKRWLFDGLVQQANVSPNVQAGYNVNSSLSAPYFRFTLGYKLSK